eukprot:1457150-Prymnesium_polylepis.1
MKPASTGPTRGQLGQHRGDRARHDRKSTRHCTRTPPPRLGGGVRVARDPPRQLAPRAPGGGTWLPRRVYDDTRGT